MSIPRPSSEMPLRIRGPGRSGGRPAGRCRAGDQRGGSITAMDPIDGDPVPADAAPPEAHRRRPRRVQAGIRQLPWRRLVNPYRPIEILSADHVEAVHAASLRILSEIGIEVLGDRALDAFRRAGATVDRRDPAGPARPRARRGAGRHGAERVHAPRPQPGARRRVRRRERRVLRGRRAGVRHATSTAAGGPATSPTSRLRPRHRRARHRPPGGRRPARAHRPAGRDPPPRHVPDVRDDARQDLAVPGLRGHRRRRRAGGRLARPRHRPRRGSSPSRA